MESNFGMDVVSFFRGGMRTGKPSRRKPWTRDNTNLTMIIGWCILGVGGTITQLVLSAFLPFLVWVSVALGLLAVLWVWYRFGTYYAEKYDLDLRW